MWHFMILLFFVLSIVFTYSLYKLYTYMRQRAPTWICSKELPATPADVSYTAGHSDKGRTVNNNIQNSNDSLQLTVAAPVAQGIPATSSGCLMFNDIHPKPFL